jgi:hypothetical protein
MFHYLVHKKLPLVSVFGRINQVYPLFFVIFVDWNAYVKLFAKTFIISLFNPNKILSIYFEPEFERATRH